MLAEKGGGIGRKAPWVYIPPVLLAWPLRVEKKPQLFEIPAKTPWVYIPPILLAWSLRGKKSRNFFEIPAKTTKNIFWSCCSQNCCRRGITRWILLRSQAFSI